MGNYVNISRKEIQLKLADVTEEDKQKLMKIAGKYFVDKRWKPEKEEQYYYIAGDGSIHCNTWMDNDFDNNCFNLRNYFKTSEEALFEAERRIVIAELQNYANNTPINWNDDKLEKSAKYTFGYNYSTQSIRIVDSYVFRDMNSIYFSSEKEAIIAINFVGEDRIKKYIFGVSEDKVN